MRVPFQSLSLLRKDQVLVQLSSRHEMPPLPSQKQAKKLPVGPVMLGFFIFVVRGLAAAYIA